MIIYPGAPRVLMCSNVTMKFGLLATTTAFVTTTIVAAETFSVSARGSILPRWTCQNAVLSSLLSPDAAYALPFFDGNYTVEWSRTDA